MHTNTNPQTPQYETRTASAATLPSRDDGESNYKSDELRRLQAELEAQIPNAWLFPQIGNVKGFTGTGPIMIVAERPSTGQFGNRSAELLYSLLEKYGASDAHITDVIKSRGRVDDPYPADIAADRYFFDRELEIVRPTRIVAMGKKVYDLLQFALAGTGIQIRQVWHYAYPGRYPQRIEEFEEQMRGALTDP